MITDAILQASIIYPNGVTNAVSLLSDDSDRLRQLQEIIGGPIEGVPLSDGRYMLVNEVGKDRSHFLNQTATDLAHASESIVNHSHQVQALGRSL